MFRNTRRIERGIVFSLGARPGGRGENKVRFWKRKRKRDKAKRGVNFSQRTKGKS